MPKFLWIVGYYSYHQLTHYHDIIEQDVAMAKLCMWLQLLALSTISYRSSKFGGHACMHECGDLYLISIYTELGGHTVHALIGCSTYS